MFDLNQDNKLKVDFLEKKIQYIKLHQINHKPMSPQLKQIIQYKTILIHKMTITHATLDVT